MKDLDRCNTPHQSDFNVKCDGPAVHWAWDPSSNTLIVSCVGCRLMLRDWIEVSRVDAEVYAVMAS